MKNKEKMYLSLPITGRDLGKVKEFAKVVKAKWEKMGYAVITPFEVCQDEGMPYSFYLGRDVEALLDCDGIILCYDWFSSKGCRAECTIAEIFKKIIKTDNTVYEENKI